jgi:predicted nucleotidyltransferase component of viral defense system
VCSSDLKIRRLATRLPVEKNKGWKSLAQRKLLIDLFKVPHIADIFWLAGGTCLSAMYLGHRESDDIDLFTTCDEIHQKDRDILDLLKKYFDFKIIIPSSQTFTSILIDGIKVDFVSDMFAYKDPRPVIILDNQTCRVDSWENVCVGKFSAFLSRGVHKDFSDIGAILGTAKDNSSLKDILTSLIFETRKRDVMADELSHISQMLILASIIPENLVYKDILLKAAEFVLNVDEEIVKLITAFSAIDSN